MENKIKVYVLDKSLFALDESNFDENGMPSKETIMSLGSKISLDDFETDFNAGPESDFTVNGIIAINQKSQWIAFKETDDNSLRKELKEKVEDWFYKTFNNISFNVAQKILIDELDYIPIVSNEENLLINFIEHDFSNIDDLIEEYKEDTGNEIKEIITEDSNFKEWLKNQKDFLSYQDQENITQEIRHRTVFEFKKDPEKETIDLCLKLGLIVIDKTENFNVIIGVNAGGISFLKEYWIPLWLSLPWNDKEFQKFKEIDYQSL